MGGKKTTDLEFEARKEKKRSEKKRSKEKRKKDGPDRNSSLIEVSEDKTGKIVQVQNFDKNVGTKRKCGEGEKKKKKRKIEKERADSEFKSKLTTEQEKSKEKRKKDGPDRKSCLIEASEDKTGEIVQVQNFDKNGVTSRKCGDGEKKKKKRKREKLTTEQEDQNDWEYSNGKNMEGNSFLESDGDVHATGEETSNRNTDDVNVEAGNKKKKRAKSEKHVNAVDCIKGKKKKAKSDKGSLRTQHNVGGPDLTENSTPRKSLKRVSFADDVEVFSLSDGPKDAGDGLVQGKWIPEEEHKLVKDAENGLVQGKRFSEEEDKLVKAAVLTYIEEHGLGDEGIDKILNCRANPEVKNCWKDIGTFLPWRPYKSIYYRAHILFERAKERNWTPEEYEEVRRAAMESKERGESKPNWRKVANQLGKHRIHVKDAWRRIKLPNMKKGNWSQEEYQTLFDLVNKDLRMRALEDKKSKHGMLRDNIKWEAISETLGTRTNPICCQKWYDQLTSPLVAEGLWADADDYRLILALDNLDACCMEDVDWDNLLEHRPGDVCQKRWNQMVKHIGRHGTKSFLEQVEMLSKRYCPDALEAREAYDSKPVVD